MQRQLASRPSYRSDVVRWRRGACVSLTIMLAAIGCGGPAHEYDAVVTGNVTIEGELAKSGTITFHPVEKDGKVAVGRIFPDGSFSLRTGQGDLRETDGGTVMPGDYIVTLSITGPPRPDVLVGEGGPPAAGPSLVDEKYTRLETSDLRRTVKAGDNVFVFDVARAKPVDSENTEPAKKPAAEAADAAEPSGGTTGGPVGSDDERAGDSDESTPAEGAPP